MLPARLPLELLSACSASASMPPSANDRAQRRRGIDADESTWPSARLRQPSVVRDDETGCFPRQTRDLRERAENPSKVKDREAPSTRSQFGSEKNSRATERRLME